jgi:hypothetical protein
LSVLSHSAATRRLHDTMLGKANRRLADHWLSHWCGDELPAWPLNTSAVDDLLPGLVAFELHPTDHLICILCGEYVRRLAGMDLVGRDWIGLAEPEQRSKRLHGFLTVASGSVGHSMRYAQHRSGDVHCIEEIMLPFAKRAGGIVPILVHLSWRPADSDAPHSAEFINTRSIPDEIGMIPLEP